MTDEKAKPRTDDRARSVCRKIWVYLLTKKRVIPEYGEVTLKFSLGDGNLLLAYLEDLEDEAQESELGDGGENESLM